MAMRTKWYYIKERWHYLSSHPGFRQSPLRTIFRLLVWRVRCLFGLPATIKLPRWDARFFLPPWWGGEGTTMIFALREDYEIELKYLERFVLPGNIVVDAGANCGIYTVAAAKLVGAKGRVLAFEPGARHASILSRNVELNGLKNVWLYNEALSDREGTARLYHHRGAVACSLAAGDSERNRFDEVTTTTLDTILARGGIDRIDLLKMDIEGAEELALRGAETMLANSHPVIVFEVNPSAIARFSLNAQGVWLHLQRFSYRFFILDEANKLNPLESPLSEGSGEFNNIIAIHEDDCQRFL